MKLLMQLFNIFLAIGAVSIGTTKAKQRVVAGGRRTVYFDCVGPVSYTTGGEVLTAAQLNELMPDYGGNLAASVADGFAKIEFFESEIDTSARQIVYDRATGKFMYFIAGVQVANAVNLSAVTIRCRIEYAIQPTA